MISLLQSEEYRPYPDRYLPAAYEAAISLQNGCYQPRWELAPQDSELPIPARGNVSLVIRVKPGSWVLAVNFTMGQLTDMGTGLRFFDQPTLATGFLPIPRLVSEPGELKLELFNTGITAANDYALILMAEPIPEVIPA